MSIIIECKEYAKFLIGVYMHVFIYSNTYKYILCENKYRVLRAIWHFKFARKFILACLGGCSPSEAPA
jgi:hypothetical protein